MAKSLRNLVMIAAAAAAIGGSAIANVYAGGPSNDQPDTIDRSRLTHQVVVPNIAGGAKPLASSARTIAPNQWGYRSGFDEAGNLTPYNGKISLVAQDFPAEAGQCVNFTLENIVVGSATTGRTNQGFQGLTITVAGLEDGILRYDSQKDGHQDDGNFVGPTSTDKLSIDYRVSTGMDGVRVAAYVSQTNSPPGNSVDSASIGMGSVTIGDCQPDPVLYERNLEFGKDSQGFKGSRHFGPQNGGYGFNAATQKTTGNEGSWGWLTTDQQFIPGSTIVWSAMGNVDRGTSVADSHNSSGAYISIQSLNGSKITTQKDSGYLGAGDGRLRATFEVPCTGVEGLLRLTVNARDGPAGMTVASVTYETALLTVTAGPPGTCK